MTRMKDAGLPREGHPLVSSRIVAGSVFAGAVVIIAAVAAWPVYRSWQFPLLVAVSAGVAAAIATLARLRRWGAWAVTGLLAGAILLLGVPLAVPSRLGGPLDLLQGLGEVASGAVVGWKDLVTVELPVGAYRNLLVPALVLFLVGTCILLLLSWRGDRIAFGAVPVAIGMTTFGLVFGRTTVSGSVSLGSLFLSAPVETALGLATLLACLLWLVWRAHDERVRALHRAAISSGVRVSRVPSATDRRRTTLAAGMVAAALLVAVTVVPFAARGAEREVLRAAVGPQVDESAAVSPLAGYRALFDDSRADAVLFTVSPGDAALPERIRIATLDAYDGEVYRSGGIGAVDDARFVRVPATLDAGEGRAVAAEVTIEGLDGIWMPTVGRLESVRFDGDRAASLADRFYYSAAASAAVQTAGGGLEPGDAYLVRGVETAAPDLAAIEAPGGGDEGVAAPESLRTWVDEHVSGSGGGALAGLVALLRDRGYLSHGLSDQDGTAEWLSDLADYSFQPSASGHSLARIDALFGRLLERETDPRAQQSGNYVAAVGDDEQFAVAVALVARELGFPSRVVLGARLSAAEPGLPTCDDGVCRAQELAAWTEVQSSDGDWIAIDVTPQFEQSPSLDLIEQRDPENVTEVRPDSVEEVLPPDPVQQDSAADDTPDEGTGADLAWLAPILRATGITLLILALALGPFLIVIGAKSARRRTRRTQGTPAERIAGGWEEYVDAALDVGHEVPRRFTRQELADAIATPSGMVLARTADRAVFSGEPAPETDAAEYWRVVDEECRTLRRGRGLWRRLWATVSLRSIFRYIAPVPAGRALTERGKRRAAEPVRLTP